MTGPFDDLIAAAALKYDVPGSLIAAIIEHESQGNPDAVGDNGVAHGLMQMHPSACTEVGADWDEMFDPAKAIDAGAAYLRWNYDRLHDWTWALAAYNRGITVILAGKTYADKVLALEVKT